MVTNEEHFGSGTFQDFVDEEAEIKKALSMLIKQLGRERETDMLFRMSATIVILEKRLQKVQTAQDWLKL